MTRRALIALLTPVHWSPPGVPPDAWRAALVEDAVDLLATLNEIEPAIAAVQADLPLATAVAWPGMPVYPVPHPTAEPAFAAATASGYDQAAVLATDAPDVPGLVIGKLLRPLTTRLVAVAPALDGPGLLGLATQLPAPDWLPDVDLDTATVDTIRQSAPRPGLVAVTPGWRRLRGPAQLATLDPAVEGWDTTRALLSP